MLARSGKRDRLVAQLAAGDLRLADAVAAALALNDEWPQVRPESYAHPPGRTPAGRVARILVYLAELQLPGDDPRGDGVRRRLAGELADLAVGRGRQESRDSRHAGNRMHTPRSEPMPARTRPVRVPDRPGEGGGDPA